MLTKFLFQKLVDKTQQSLPYHLKQTFPPIIWIFAEGEGDRIKSSLSVYLLYSFDVSSKEEKKR